MRRDRRWFHLIAVLLVLFVCCAAQGGWCAWVRVSSTALRPRGPRCWCSTLRRCRWVLESSQLLLALPDIAARLHGVLLALYSGASLPACAIPCNCTACLASACVLSCFIAGRRRGDSAALRVRASRGRLEPALRLRPLSVHRRRLAEVPLIAIHCSFLCTSRCALFAWRA